MDTGENLGTQKFGKYRLLERIAHGGMAEIWLATEDVGGGGRVLAIKRIIGNFDSQPEFIDMFRSETRMMAGFTHPNIIQFFDHGSQDGMPYIAMELVEGKNLREFVLRLAERKEPFPIEVALYVFEQAATAMAYAHAFCDPLTGRPLNVVHRDISPQNIMVSYDGAVKVFDFGIAKGTTNTHQTSTGIIKGKPGYLSPEQVSGAVLDCRSDVFALGIVLWELLAGRKLFARENTIEVLQLIEGCDRHVKPPSLYNAKVPVELDALVLRALKRDPKERFQTADELATAARRLLAQLAPELSRRALGEFTAKLFTNELVAERTAKQALYREAGLTGGGASAPAAAPAAAKPDPEVPELVETMGDIEIPEPTATPQPKSEPPGIPKAKSKPRPVSKPIVMEELEVHAPTEEVEDVARAKGAKKETPAEAIAKSGGPIVLSSEALKARKPAPTEGRIKYSEASVSRYGDQELRGRFIKGVLALAAIVALGAVMAGQLSRRFETVARSANGTKGSGFALPENLKTAATAPDPASAAAAAPTAAPAGVEPQVEAKLLSQCVSDPSFCETSADAYENDQQFVSAVKFHQAACNGGRGWSCYRVGALTLAGSGVAASEAKALEFFEKGCQLGSSKGQACFEAGNLYRKSANAESQQKAADAYDHACAAEHGEACAAAGQMYAEGQGVAKSPPRAVTYYTSACRLNVAAACERFKELTTAIRAGKGS